MTVNSTARFEAPAEITASRHRRRHHHDRVGPTQVCAVGQAIYF